MLFFLVLWVFFWVDIGPSPHGRDFRIRLHGILFCGMFLLLSVYRLPKALEALPRLESPADCKVLPRRHNLSAP